MFIDFLGNTIEAGDQIIYTPKGKDSGELVLAEVLEIRAIEKDRYGYDEDGKYGVVGTYTVYKPTLQPMKSTSSYRTRRYVAGEGFVEAPARPTRLDDMSSAMLYKKKEN